MSQAIPKDPSIRTSDAGSNDPGVVLDDSSTPQKRPRRRLLSRFIRSAAVAAGEEVFASWLARDRNKYGNRMTSRATKMALYGAFINAPLTYLLLKELRVLFESRKGNVARVLEILVGMLVVAPIQKIVHILSIGLIAGARTFHQLRATVKAAFLPVMTVVWFAASVAVAFAQIFLPENVWPQFFGLMSFVVHTYTNSMIKKKGLVARRRKYFGDGKGW